MGLVDYSSDDSSQPPPSKRLKGPESKMPPLPAAFHDLYASTVRPSVADDPSLHQGRKRVNPHVPGNWPTHVYIEWHLTKAQHDLLDALVRRAQRAIGPIHLHNFLTSDLGTDLPLHVSLSRPLSLPSAIKDDYLAKISAAVGAGGVGSFSVRPSGLAWHTSPDSDRTFFVLRVVGAECHERKSSVRPSTNPDLTRLLDRCNAVAEQFGQPPLYQAAGGEGADTAFHVSVGWTMGAPDEETCLRVLAFFRDEQFAALTAWRVVVDGVKVKIGNVVSAVPLGGKGEKDTDGRESLYGL